MSDITAKDVYARSNEPAFVKMIAEHGLDGIILLPRAQHEALMALVPFVIRIADIRKPITDDVYREARQHKAVLCAAGIDPEEKHD